MDGVNGRGTAIAALTATCVQDYARIKQLSLAMAFFDVRKAFDSVCREVLMAPQLTDVELVHVLERLGVPPDQFQAVIASFE